MPRNEDGEFEVVLRNRQVLSLAFVVVVLLGIFFTAGYIMGRSSSPAADAGKAAKATAAPGTPIVVEPAGPAQRPAAGEPVARAGKGAPETAGAAQKGRPAPAREAEPKAAGVAPSGPITPAEPSPGQVFLQVAAVRQAEAELLVEVLRKKGFQAQMAPVPAKSDFRVLVGPLADAAAIAKAKTDLEAAGFKETILRKY